jgi:hypothetical protein
MSAVLHIRAAAILPFARELVNLTFFVFLVLDQRWLRQAISLLEYHDDLPPFALAVVPLECDPKACIIRA